MFVINGDQFMHRGWSEFSTSQEKRKKETQIFYSWIFSWALTWFCLQSLCGQIHACSMTLLGMNFCLIQENIKVLSALKNSAWLANFFFYKHVIHCITIISASPYCIRKCWVWVLLESSKTHKTHHEMQLLTVGLLLQNVSIWAGMGGGS